MAAMPHRPAGCGARPADGPGGLRPPPAGPQRGRPPAGIQLSLRPDPCAAGCPLVARTPLRTGSSEPALGGPGGLRRAAAARRAGSDRRRECRVGSACAPGATPDRGLLPDRGEPRDPEIPISGGPLAPAVQHFAQQAGWASLPTPIQKEDGETESGRSLPDLKFYGLMTCLRPGNRARETEDQGFSA